MKIIRNDRGMTLTELLVVMSLMSIVVAATYMLMNSVGALADSNIARAAAGDEAQMFVDRLGRELRSAMEAEEGEGAFELIAARKTIFYTDTDSDAVPERVTYEVDADGTVYRKVALCEDADSLPPFESFGADSAPQKVISKVDPSWAGAIFDYRDINGAATAVPKAVSLVNVEIHAHATSGGVSRTSMATLTARPRSVHNSLGGGS
jgi:prepilin-type N-terminal cleavage/methylation domain-containing protein